METFDHFTDALKETDNKKINKYFKNLAGDCVK